MVNISGGRWRQGALSWGANNCPTKSVTTQFVADHRAGCVRQMMNGNSFFLSAATQNDGEMKPGHQVFLIVISTWLTLSVFGNICFIIVIVKNKQLRNITNWLICNIALSDLLLAAFAIPQLLHDISHTGDYYERKYELPIYIGLKMQPQNESYILLKLVLLLHSLPSDAVAGAS